MSEHLHSFTDTHLTVIGFFIFFVLFIIFVATTYLPSQIQIHRDLALLPLKDETEGSANGGR